jgi:hypothetical protein
MIVTGDANSIACQATQGEPREENEGIRTLEVDNALQNTFLWHLLHIQRQKGATVCYIHLAPGGGAL